MKFLKNNLTLAISGVLAMGVTSVHAASSLKPYGYVQADFIYSTNQDTGNLSGGYALDTTPGLEKNGSFQGYAITSRFGLDYKSDEYIAVIEGDFYQFADGPTRSTDFRLRHAYGKHGNILAGQTWSTFNERDWIAYPRVLDFDEPVGLSYDRRAQLRITSGNFDFAIEDPSASLADPSGGTVRSQIPDLVARYASKGDSFSWYASTLFKSTEVDGGNADGDRASVFAVNGAVRFELGNAGALSLAATRNANNRTTYGFAGRDLVVNGDKLETVDSTAYNVTFQGKAGPKTNYNITYGQLKFDDEFADILSEDGAGETFSTLHMNVIYSPTQNVTYGFEISHVEREEFNGNNADNTRFQFAARYTF